MVTSGLYQYEKQFVEPDADKPSPSLVLSEAAESKLGKFPAKLHPSVPVSNVNDAIGVGVGEGVGVKVGVGVGVVVSVGVGVGVGVRTGPTAVTIADDALAVYAMLSKIS